MQSSMAFSSLRLCLDRRKQDGEGPGKYFYGVIGQARGRFFRGRWPTVLSCDWFCFLVVSKDYGVFMSFPPFILTFSNLRYFLKVSKLNIFTNIVRIYNAKKRYNVMLFRSC